MSKKVVVKDGPIHTLLIATAIVFFWRGAWGLMDLYLIPSNEVASMTISLILGILILIITRSLIKLD